MKKKQKAKKKKKKSELIGHHTGNGELKFYKTKIMRTQTSFSQQILVVVN
jgi:hypothetical protein